MLRNAKLNYEANIVEFELQRLDSPDTRSIALKTLVSMCHMKWLGDIDHPQIPLNDWLSLLTNMEKAAQKTIEEKCDVLPVAQKIKI